jgi:prophage maintenance system killer protein
MKNISHATYYFNIFPKSHFLCDANKQTSAHKTLTHYLTHNIFFIITVMSDFEEL